MTSFGRIVATALLVGAMIGALAGCGQPQPRPAAKALQRIQTAVPRVTDLPLKKAEGVLRLQALRVGKVALQETKNRSLHSQVFDQHPAPGTKVRGGTAVDLKVYRYVPGEKESSPAKAK